MEVLIALAEGDCEAIRSGLTAQPINAWSSLAYAVAAVPLLSQRPLERRRGLIGVALIGVAIGSFLFHGPMEGPARWIHDVTIVTLLVALATAVSSSRSWMIGSTAALPTVALVLVVLPDAGTAMIGAAAVVAAASVATSARRNPWRGSKASGFVAIALLVGAASVNVLGRTGGPLCSPKALLQWHAVWHVLTAGAVVAYTAWVIHDTRAEAA